MYWLVALMTLSLIAIIGVGLYFEWHPLPKQTVIPAWVKSALSINIATFFAAQIGILWLGMQSALAETATQAGGVPDVSIGMGLAMIGVGLPTAAATVGAAIAVGPIGSAALAVLAEKPEMFGRTLVYMGLAEGIAIYGLVMSILMLGRLFG